MIQDAHVLIVGSGPLGTAAACRLAESGLRVVVVEGGSAISEPPGSHFRNQARFRRDPDSFFAAIDPYFAPIPGDLPGAADSTLVGGQGILWTNNCPRAPAFQRWDAMSAAGWDRAYTAAEGLLLVVPDPAAASRTGSGIQERLREILAADDRIIQALPLSGRMLGSADIHFNGPRDILDAATPAVRERIALRSGVAAVRLRHDDNRVTGVDVTGADGAVSLTAPVVLVAGGAIATPRLLHRSGIRPEPLGRGVSFHAVLFGQIILESAVCSPAGEDDVAPRLWIPPTEGAPWHIQVLRDTCPLKPAEAVDNPHSLLEFQAFLPMAHREENALTMDDGGRPTIRFSFSDSDREGMKAVEADVRRLAERLGRWRRGCEPTWLPHGNGHIVGTCRMDCVDRPGVANRLGKVHGFENLYLATVGLIPSPVSVNPTLTGLALAVNTSEEIAIGVSP